MNSVSIFVASVLKSGNLTDAEFKTLATKMLNELRGSIDEFSENFNTEIKKKNRKTGNENYKREPVRNEEHIIWDEEYIRGYQQSG